MAEIKLEKGTQSGAEVAAVSRPSGDGATAVIDLQSLTQVLNAHAKAIAVALGEVVGEKLAEFRKELRTEARETRRAEEKIAELSENQKRIEQRIEHALQRQTGEDWLARQPAGDREPLKTIDKKLHELEETLEGPQSLLERGEGEKRPPVQGEATWQLPDYEPVPPDFDKPDFDNK
jgi:chromosome segregation ATPase